MLSIEVLYKRAQDKNRIYQGSNLGAYDCLTKAVKGRNFSRKSLVKAFKDLMPKEEYAEDETFELVNHLEYLTCMPVEGEKQP